MQFYSSNVVLNKMQIWLKANKIQAKETAANSNALGERVVGGRRKILLLGREKDLRTVCTFMTPVATSVEEPEKLYQNI